MMTRFASSFLRGAALSLALALVFAGCGSDSRTQVTLYVDASGAVQTATVAMRVEFFEPGETEPLHAETVPMAEWPVTFALLPDVADDFVAHVYALDDADEVVAEGVAWTSFVKGSTRFYYMYLDATPCSGAMLEACAPDEFCVEGGACITAVFTEGSDLPTTPGEGESPNPCEGVTCGTDAICIPFFGVGTCACPDGFAGDPAELCIDVCGQASAPDCGANGACDVDPDGEPFCACTFPFTGEACDACGEGWVLNGAVCEAACIGTCGTHEICNDQLTVPACTCAPGYDDEGAGCTWFGRGRNGGGVAAYTFEDATPWTVNQAVLETDTFGAMDGSLEFRQFGICGASSATQAVTMPNYLDAEPFVLVAHALSNTGGGFETCDAYPNVRLGDSIQPLTFSTDATRTARVCAGAAAYGGGIDFSIIPNAATGGSCFSAGQACVPVSVDDIEFAVATPGECPVPGLVTNGTFSSGGTGWTAGSGTTFTGGVMRLQFTNLCQTVNASTTLSLPNTPLAANPAISMTVTGTAGEYLPLLMNEVEWTRLRGTGGAQTFTMCLPPWTHGTVRDLRFRRTVSGACANVFNVTFDIDNVTYVSDPNCAGDGWLDGGFETPTSGSSWSFTGTTGTFTSDVFANASEAHSGNSTYRFANTAFNGFSWSVSHVIQVPTVAEGQVPVVRYWARNPSANPTYTVTVAPGATVAVPGSAWTQFTACLDPATIGQETILAFNIGRGGNALTGQTLYIDDVTIESAASCP